MRLAKSGYGQGDPDRIKAMPVDTVMRMAQYEIFATEYEKKFMELNTKRD